MTFDEWHKKEFGPNWEETGIARAFKDRRREGWNGGYAEGLREVLRTAINLSCITCQHGYKPVKNSEGQFMHLNGSALCNANRFHKLIAKLDGK